ncbi:bifunctional diguanylate cyclase/phosphodiesterase [Methylomarinum vadi]|uniref:bifunctional diguanylate cyclase/phosphodiesterase n=1 Tax=Methylomarinum vadi TaxID=438855 RepID=UPI00055CED9F|nr:EAL domain-containing protein [Methylomarinum vadi]
MKRYVKKKLFFSLTWKALFAVTVSTLLVSGSVFVLGNYTFEQNHKQKRKVRHEQYQQAFASVLKQLQQKETELSWLIPSLIASEQKEARIEEQIKRLLDNNWFKIELESDIRSICLFSPQGQLEGEWGERVDSTIISASWIEAVFRQEKPLSKIVCSGECLQFHALPFLLQGKLSGVFIFVSGIAEIVLQMKAITGADVGILIETKGQSLRQQTALPNWSVHVAALTESPVNLPLLTALRSRHADIITKDSLSFIYKGNTYDIFTIPFGEKSHQARLIIIDNITQELLEKNKAVNLYAVSGLSSIVLSGIILFLMFVRPTHKLKKIINLLPLIADKQYSKVRQFLPSTSQTKFLADEIDILGSVSHNLIDTLSRLDHEVEQRNQHLIERGRELQNERNFVANILNTAQVIIMRLDRFGQILSINKFGENVTGYNDIMLSKHHFFTDLIYDTESHQLITDMIDDLLREKYKTFQHECSLYSLEGMQLFISWFFTMIDNPDTQPEILAVGLDLTERKKAETELAWLADHDPLTRLFNRRRFEMELRRVVKEAQRFNHTGALIFFDIDQFKYINDSSGHQAGDQLLLKVSEKLRAIVRSTDILARFGGDEFVILAPEVAQDQAESLITKIFRFMQEVEIVLEDTLHKVTISAGLLMFPVSDYTEQDLMASVDIAMYKAKAAGRGTWCLASIDDLNREDIKQRVNWKAKIEKALVDDRFVLYFQPILHIKSRTISHYECLLRMIDENGNIVPPAFFIHVAEQTGLISLIDQRVLKLALQAQRDFIKAGHDITLSVNLSGDMISNPDAMIIFSKIFAQFDVPLQKFIFEVTETQAVTNLYAATDLITHLTELGGSFALDDFGVGFSSMNHLKQLPIQFLKIDGEFIKHLPGTREDRLFVNAIHEVAHGMNIKSIAEFVENNEILDTLAKIGIDYAQGYGIGKPTPQPEFLH